MYSERITSDLEMADKLFSKKIDSKSIEDVIVKIENGERPSLEEASMLLRTEDETQRERIIRIADDVTRKNHGNKVGLIAPLYFSNICWNDCSCCDMSKNNKPPFDMASMDQAIAAIRDTFPPMLWSFYQSCKKEGFEDEQAFFLTVEMLRGSMHNPNQK